MPRPQRKKVAPLTTISRSKLNNKNTGNTTQSTNLGQKRFSERLSAAVNAKSSSDSDILGPQDDGSGNPDLMMTGALHQDDAPALPRHRSKRSMTASSDSQQIDQQRVIHVASKGAASYGASVPQPAASTSNNHAAEAALDAMDALLATSKDDNTPQRGRSLQTQSGLNSRRTSVQRPTSSMRLFGTPGMNSSVQALTAFKRRKRQGSIVGRMRRVSALNNSVLVSSEADSRLDHFNSDLDDFNPDDESTPLHGTIMKDNLRTTSSRKRRYDGSPIDPSRSIVPLSSSPLPSDDRHANADHFEAEVEEEDVVPDTAPTTQNAPDPVPEDDVDEITSTMAPPLSSSVLEPSSPTSSAHGTRDAQYRSVNMSTIELTSLLPKTRRRTQLRRGTRDVYHLQYSTMDVTSDDNGLSSPSRSENDGEDETFTSSARQTRSKRATTKSTSTTNAKRNTGLRKALAVTKAAAIEASGKHSPAKKTKRKSYRKATEADKENDEDVSYAAEYDTLDDTTIIETAKSMKMLKDKFAEIDQFEMSYETVDVGGENSLWR